MSKPQTKFAGRSPWGTKAANVQYVDVNGIEITDDKFPQHRIVVGGKYEALFENLKPGQRIKCASDDVQKISGALRKHIKTRELPYKVRAVTSFPADKMGGVWMLDK